MNVITMKYKCNQRDMNEPRILERTTDYQSTEKESEMAMIS